MPPHLRGRTRQVAGVWRRDGSDTATQISEGSKPLPDSKADFEISLKWNRGQPGPGKCRSLGVASSQLDSADDIRFRKAGR